MRDTLLSSAYLYDSREVRNRILRLQRMLRTLSDRSGNPAWNTAENGEYDERTRGAVRALQEAYALPVTGIVDLFTWNLLREQMDLYGTLSRTPAAVQLYPDPARRIEEGEYSDLVLHMQIMLNALRLYYDGIPHLPLSGYYDSMTADAVRTFREINGLEADSGADAALWNRLAQEYNRISGENQ